ncbi:hypothetical protein CDD83_7995 [Cordyceps sp. RAO-2017]|nr:hypothetical protein CDD83_7995 [Cordyceps sp. RAO-2017]
MSFPKAALDEYPAAGGDEAAGGEVGPGPEAAPMPGSGDDGPTTSRREMKAWYLYYVGANGLALFNFGPTAFQNLLEQAASGSGGLLLFAGRRRDVNSIVLLANGMSFAMQAALLLGIGAYADFGSGRRWVLLAWSGIAYGVGFGWLAVHEPARWRAGVGLYVVGLVAYQLTLTYWTAAFPSLARHTARLKEARLRHARGELSQPELDRRDELERSRLSNVAFWLQSVGEVLMLAVAVGLMFALGVRRSAAANAWGLSALIAFATAAWLLLSLPWFVLERTRPGMAVPPGRSIVTAGLWQLREAVTHMLQLRQSLIYLVGYFLLGDSLNTTVTVIATLQNQVVAYDTLTLTYLLMVGIAAQGLGIGAFWLVQRRFRLGAKPMFNAVMVFIVLLDGWGMAGNWTDRLGFRNVWEIWLYQALYGLLVCPWYSYSQIIISSVTPRGHEFLFFSVFNVAGKASSFIGPLISSAIIDASPGGRNNSAPFYFLFALSLVSAAGIWTFLDLDKSAREQEAFLARKRLRQDDSSS